MSGIMVMSCAPQQKKPVYPETAKVDTVDVYFGTQVPDPYRWLENDTSAATTAWVEAQNKVTNEYLSQIPFRENLLKRLTELADYEKISAPVKKHGKYYFSKNDGLQNQSVFYVQDSLDGEPRVFLDPNKLSDDGTVALTGLYFSHDGKYTAYTISRSGSDWSEIYVMDTESGKLLEDHIEWAKFTDAAWQGDGFYYSAYDAPTKGKEFSNVNENHKIYYHKIGEPQSKDKLIYQNPAYPKRFYTSGTSEDERILFLTESGAGRGNNLFIRDLKKPASPFIQLTTDLDYQYYPIEVIGDRIYIYTNYGRTEKPDYGGGHQPSETGRLERARARIGSSALQRGSDRWQTVPHIRQRRLQSRIRLRPRRQAIAGNRTALTRFGRIQRQQG